jgi:hypothetical protein
LEADDLSHPPLAEPRNRIREGAVRLWERWKVVAHIIGNFQARVLLTAFYFIMVPPFALIVKLFKDPLGLRPRPRESLWLDRPLSEATPDIGRRQF